MSAVIQYFGARHSGRDSCRPGVWESFDGPRAASCPHNVDKKKRAKREVRKMETEVAAAARDKVIMAVEAMAEMGSVAEVEAKASQDRVLHRAVAQIGSHPTTTVVVDRVPREATVRDEAKAKDGHQLHKVAKVPMPIDKKIRSAGSRTGGSSEVSSEVSPGKARAKVKDRTVRTGTRTKAIEDKANKIKARTRTRTEVRVNKTKVRTTIIKARTTTIRGRTTTTTPTTTRARTKMGTEVKASRTRGIRDKDRHKTKGSFRTTTTTIITIIIMAKTTSPSQKSLRRRPRSRPQRPNRPRLPPPKPSQQKCLLLPLHPHQKRRLSLLNHRHHCRHRRHQLPNKPQNLRL